MKTKVIALDVYGTMLSTIGEESPKRKGLDELLERCKNKGLTLCTCSDGNTSDVKSDLKKAGVDLEYFNEYFEMPREGKNFTKKPKDFRPILNHYSIYPSELTVIGDREARDILPAKKLGCNTVLVPEYRTERDYDNFDINSVEVR